MRFSLLGVVVILLLFWGVYSTAQSAVPQVTVLGNSIDLPLVKAYVDTLRALGFDVATISPGEFKQHQSDPLILILGGQHAPEGVGVIVGGILTDAEKKESLAGPQAMSTVVIPSIWTDKQKVIVFAGYGKEQTRRAFGNAQGDIIKSLKFNDSSFLENVTSAPTNVPPIDATQPFTEIDAYQAATLINTTANLYIMDVRGVPFYQAGHIPNAVNLQQSKLEGRISSLNPGRTYLLYCGGNSESIRAGNQLAAAGFKNVYRLVDGYVAWRMAGFPREKTAP